jgi:hypothetical protein
VSPVRAAALLGRLVDLDVLDDEIAGVEALGVGIRLGVLEEAEEELGGLGGPARPGRAELFACEAGSHQPVPPNVQRCSSICVAESISSRAPFDPGTVDFPRREAIYSPGLPSALTLRGAAGAARISPERHDFLLFDDVVEVGEGAGDFHPIDGLGRFAGVFKGDAKVSTTGAG